MLNYRRVRRYVVNVSKWFLMFLDLFSMNMFRVASSLETVFMIVSDKIISGVSSIRNPA